MVPLRNGNPDRDPNADSTPNTATSSAMPSPTPLFPQAATAATNTAMAAMPAASTIAPSPTAHSSTTPSPTAPTSFSDRFKTFLQSLTWTNEDGKRQPNFLGHCVISGLLLGTMAGGAWHLSNFADRKHQEWMGKLMPVALPQQAFADKPLVRQRLDHQLAELQGRMQTHWSVTGYFYKQYFLSIGMTLPLTLAAGTLGFFVSQKGWKQSNNALINIFLVTSGGALFFGQLPGVFRQDLNLSTNWTTFQNYNSLRNEILSYSATGGQVMVEGQGLTLVPPEQFLLTVDKRLNTLSSLPIQFDTSQLLKSTDVFNSVNLGGASSNVLRGTIAPENSPAAPAPTP